MVVVEGCSTSPDQHTLLPDPHLSTMLSQGHPQHQIWMEDFSTRERHCCCLSHWLYPPDHSGFWVSTTSLALFRREPEPPLFAAWTSSFLSCSTSLGVLKREPEQSCIRGIMQCSSDSGTIHANPWAFLLHTIVSAIVFASCSIPVVSWRLIWRNPQAQ